MSLSHPAAALALLVMLLLPVRSHGLPPEEAKKLALGEFRKGGELFGRGEYEAAAAHFNAALDLFPDPAYVFNLAVCYERLKRWSAAVQHYDRYLKEVPEGALSAKARERREAAARELAAQQAVVVVSSTPADARAVVTSVAGDSSCDTPCRIRTDPGAVTVVLTHAGQTKREQKEVRAGETWTLDVTFDAPKQGTARVRVDVPGATVRVGGQVVAADTPTAAAPGTVEVLVTAPGYRAFRAPLVVEADRETTLDVHLDPSTTGRTQRIAGWATLSAGGVALATGAVLGGLALARQSDAEAMAEAGPGPGRTQDDLDALKGRADGFALAADITLGVAAAGIVAGLVLWLTAPSDADDVEAAAWAR